MTLPSIGFIGVGLMGAGMASCLLAAGHPLAVLPHTNRSPIEDLLAKGAIEAANALELLRGCDVLMTCVPNADVIADLADELVRHFAAGQMWIDTSTSRPETSAQLARDLSAQGAVFADAPLTGGPQQAREGTLASLVGCDAAYFSAVEAIVGVYSKTTRRFGDAGTGHAAKLLNNFVTQGTIMLLADAFQCAAKMNVDARALYDIMMSGAARSGTLQKAVGPALDGNYDGAQFTIINAAKDLRYARDLIEHVAPSRTALAELVADRFATLVSDGRGDRFVSTMLAPEDP